MDENGEHRLDQDMGDDEQEDEIFLYERYIEDPPANLVIREPEDQEVGITAALAREWSRREQRHEEVVEDERSAEEAAVEVESEDELETRSID